MAVEPEVLDAEGLAQALSDMEVVAHALSDHSSVDGYQADLLARLRKLHHYYAPVDGDQWPEDLVQRPGKIHITSNFCKPAVDIDARLQAILPRIVCKANGIDEAARLDAEAAEKVMERFLDLSGWEVWLNDFTKIKCIYGFGVLKVFWNVDEDRPDARPIENPGNLRIGWGASDFSVMDWAIYESKISPFVAMRRWPHLNITPTKDGEPIVEYKGGDHADPLSQMTPVASSRPQFLDRPVVYQPSDYEQRQVTHWDYWFKDAKGTVWNAVIIGRSALAEINPHPELPDIPYIHVENDHEPGVPWGIATHEPLIDIQVERNRALAHALQLVADEIDPSWQMTGDNADSIPDGIVPRAGEIIAAGAGNEIKLVPKSLNFPPVQQGIAMLDEDFYNISGLPRILFGQSLGSRVSGTALAVQTEAAQNRLDPKRRRLYAGINEMLHFWAYMTVKRNPKAGTQSIGDAVKGYRHWQIIAPEITPKDVLQATTNVINKVQAKLISLETGRDELGYSSPQDEGKLVVEERSNVDLFPGDVQVKTAVLTAMQALQTQQQQQQAQAAAQGGAAQGALSQQNQQGQPALDQGNSTGTQPATLPGSPAPGGGPPVGGGVQTTLVRPNPATGQANALDQLALQQRRF